MKWALYRFLNRYVLPHYGFVLRKSGADGNNYVVSEPHRARLAREVAQVLQPWLARTALAGDATAVAALVAEFLALYRERPITDNTGGAGFNSSLCIFLIARLAAPAAIIDSGTFQGQSAWLLRRACPNAVIHSFDVEHANLVHREPDVRYHLADWSQTSFNDVDPARALCLFDDHVSHARRIREAHERGYRLLLLDDDVPVHALHATGGPPIPTASMLFDPDLKEGEEVVWIRRGRRYRYVVRRNDLAARELVADYLPVPDLSTVTRYRPNNGLSLVRLKQ